MNRSIQSLLEKFVKAFANNDTEAILELVTNDIQWDIVGDQYIAGKENFKLRLEAMSFTEPNNMRIDKIITHDKNASVNGMMTTPDGNSYGFCDIITFDRFTNPKIKILKSYSIELKGLNN